MRKFIPLFLLFITVSCSSDDNASAQNSSNFLVGNWKVVAYIDEHGYPWPEEDGYMVFTENRVKDYDDEIGGELNWESEYKYLPDSKEAIILGFVFKVEIEDYDNIRLLNGCCGPGLVRVD